MNRLVRLVAIGAAVVLSLSAVAATSAQHARPGGDVVGHVYVNNNSAGENSISGFDRHADGSLTPIATAKVVPAQFSLPLLDGRASRGLRMEPVRP